MPKGKLSAGESTPAQERIKAAQVAIRKLQFDKKKIDLEIEKFKLDIEAANEELNPEPQ